MVVENANSLKSIIQGRTGGVLWRIMGSLGVLPLSPGPKNLTMEQRRQIGGPHVQKIVRDTKVQFLRAPPKLIK